MLIDDVIEYSLQTHHNEEEGKKKRATIWKVTGLLTLLTIVEVILCSFIKQDSPYWTSLKICLIVMTLIKWVILAPYAAFIAYLLFISITEASAVGDAWTEHKIDGIDVRNEALKK
jgi:cytochrome c oxidase subunit IV